MYEPYSEKDFDFEVYKVELEVEDEGRTYLQLAITEEAGAIGFAQKLITGIFLLSLHTARIALKLVGEDIEIVVDNVEIEH
jgi:hypothetical protein